MITATHLTVHNSTDTHTVAQTLAAAFRDEPVTEWIFPAELGHRDERVYSFFLAVTELFLDNGGTIFATPGHEGVLVWADSTSEPTQHEHERFTARLRSSLGESADRAITVLEQLEAHQPAEVPSEHYHVMFAATHPGKPLPGARYALSTAMTTHADRTGQGIYAEASSTRNLRLWQRLGCRRIGREIRIPGGPALYPIFYHARPAQLSS